MQDILFRTNSKVSTTMNSSGDKNILCSIFKVLMWADMISTEYLVTISAYQSKQYKPQIISDVNEEDFSC